MTRKFFSFVFYITAFSLIAAAVLITAASYFLKDLQYYTQLTLKQLQETTGYQVTLDDINWSIAQGAGVRIDNLKITDTAHNVLLFSCKKAHIMTSLFPLFEKHFVISKVLLDEPEILLYRGEDAEWATLPLFSMSPENARRYGSLFDFSISLKNLFITNGKILCRDDAYKVTSSLDHVKISLKLNRKTGHYDVSAYAEQQGKDAPGTITIDSTFLYAPAKDVPQKITGSGSLKLSSLSLQSLMPYIADYASFMDPNTLYTASVDAAILPEWKISAGGRVSSQNFSLRLQNAAAWPLGPCAFDFDLKADHGLIRCDTFVLSFADDIVLKGNLELANYRDKAGNFELRVSSNEIAIPRIMQRLNACTILSDQGKSMLQRLHEGKAAFKNMRLQGSLKQQPAEYISALQGDIAITNVAVETFDTVPPLIIPRALFKLQNDSLAGDMSARWLAGDNHTLQAEISSLHHKPGVKILVNSKFPAQELNGLIALLPFSAPPSSVVQIASGLIDAQTTLVYKNKFAVSSVLDLTRASYRISNALVKPEALSNTLSVAFESMPDMSGPGLFSFDFLSADTLKISGAAKSLNPLSIEGSYALKAFDSASCNLPSVPPGMEIKGRLSGTGTFSFPAKASLKLPLLGSAAVEGFEIREPGAPAPLISGSISTTIHEQSVSVHNCSARVGETYGTFHGELDSLLPPRGNLTVIADHVDIDDFVGVVDRLQNIPDKNASPAPPPGKGKNIFLSTSLDMDFTLKKLNFLSWDFDNGTCRYIYKNGSMLWDAITLTGGNGTISGSVLFDFSRAPVRTLAFTPTRSNVDFLWAVPAMKRKKSITGTLDLKGEFSSTFSKKTEIAENMRGNFRAVVTDGLMKKFTALSKILSMLNISRIIMLEAPDLLAKGMPFDSITSDLTMEHAVMKTDNLMLKGPAMNLSAVGSINLIKEKVDLIVGAQILETIGKILGNIPVAGELFTGKDKSLTLGYFHVKGPYEDASVTPMPLKSLSAPVIKVFKTLFTIPHDIFSSDKDKDADNKTDSAGQ